MRAFARIGVRLAATAAAALFTGAAAPDWFVTPPPPRSYEVADIDEWVKTYIVVGDYLQTGYNTKALSFISTTEVDMTGPRQLLIWLRFENFRPALVGDSEIRSARILTEFDCTLGLYRQLGFELYSGNNLTGMPSTKKAPEAGWMVEPPGSASAVNASVLCAFLEDAEKDPP